jgi:hypothetical protein
MPTRDVLDSFWRDWNGLTPEQQRLFHTALEKFVADLRGGKGFRSGLRVKGVRGAEGIFELTWAGDGRATFAYGRAVKGEEPHIIWRRIGSHRIFEKP